MHNSWEFLFKKSSKDFVALVPEKTFAMVHREKRYIKSFSIIAPSLLKLITEHCCTKKNSLINRYVTSLLQNGIITILSIKKYSILCGEHK